MIGLVVADTVLVVLLGALVAGLLRSHADIARALHELGVPLGDPARRAGDGSAEVRLGLRRSESGTLEMGPAIPPRSAGAAVFDVEGSTPSGDGLAIAATGARWTLLSFLSSGCATCAPLWHELTSSGPTVQAGVDVRVVIVTKGADGEQPKAVARLAGPAPSVPVVMSTKAWTDYEVPGSPFFVLIDGSRPRRAGEGTARSLGEVGTLISAATEEREPPANSARRHSSRRSPLGRDDVASVDEELSTAGIRAGDPSLFPRTMTDIHPPAQPNGRGAAP